jgi:hypothetical protein
MIENGFQRPNRLNVWVGYGAPAYRGEVALAGNVVLVFPATVEDAEPLLDAIDATWATIDPERSPARRWFAYADLTFGSGSSSTIFTEPAEGELLGLVDDGEPRPGMPRIVCEPSLIPAFEEEAPALEKLRRQNGVAWVRENWQRLREEWAWIQSM